MFEDFLTLEMEGGRNLVADYLKRRGFRETATSRAYMNGLRNSVMSLYEISDLRPGESFRARDLIRGGEPVLVSEKSGSRQLRPWTRIAARIVRAGPKTVMGGGILIFDQQTSDALVDLVRETRKSLAGGAGPRVENLSFDDVLADFAPVFSATWVGIRLDEILDPPPLALSNSDGDDLLFTTVHYPLLAGVAVKTVRSALRQCPELHAETASFWNWLGEAAPARATRSDRGAESMKVESWMLDGSTVLGTIDLRRRSVVLDVNSAERARRGQVLLGSLLDGLVAPPSITSQTLDALRASRPREGIDETPLDLPSEEQQGLVHEWLDRHYRAVLDEPVPMLGDRIPRELALEKGGPEQLAAWLKFIENGAAKAAGGSNHDLVWMWEELGIARLRR